MTAKLQTHSVRKHYGSVTALRETSLAVEAGEFLTLLGPSGSGKTTLLGILSGLVKADSGEVWIDGALATNAPPHSRGLGVVFQNYALFPHLTVFENIAFPLRMRRVREAEIQTRVRKMLDLVRLPHHAGRLPRELSGGQQQRIAFARCAVFEPPIILMDEPLGALDKKLRESMQIEIKRLHSELSTTIIYVTHDQEEAMTMSDRICLMNEGGVEQLGTPAELYFTPSTVFAADFLGQSNLLPATVLELSDAHLVLRLADGSAVKAPKPVLDVVPGEDVTLMVRPQHMHFRARSPGRENALRVRVDDVVMAGALTQIHMTSNWGVELTALELTLTAQHKAARGEVIEIFWAPEDSLVLPGERRT